MRATWLPMQSERVILRPFREEDVAAFHTYRSDPDVAALQGWDPISLDDAHVFVGKQIAGRPGTLGTGAQIAIELRATGEMIGDVFLRTPAEQPYAAEIGFTLTPARRGHGYATEAVQLLLQGVFEKLGKHRVTALTYARNERSVRLLERVGMRREAHHIESSQLDGEWVDDYVYAILRWEWRKSRAADSG